MNYKSAIDALIQIERSVPVNDLWIDGIQVWPLLRMLLWPDLLRLDYSLGPAHYQPPVEPIVAPADGMRRTDSGLDPELRRSVRVDLARRLRPADVMVYSRPQDHTESFEEGRIDRLADPMVWLARERGLRSVKLSATGRTAEPIRACQIEPSLFVDIDQFLVQAPPTTPWSNVSSVVASLAGSFGPISLTDAVLRSCVRRLNLRADYFELILEQVRPRLVALGVFYSMEALALTLACRRQGIPVVDIQHGKQGLYHAMYGYWSASPPAGYDLLPDYFWQWGEESVSQSSRTLPAGVARPRPVLGGNLWLSFWLGETRSCLTPGPKDLFRTIEAAGRKVLLPLQPIDEPLPAPLLAAMRQAPPDWLWMVRLHPHRRADIPGIDKRLRDAGVRSYAVESVTDAPLYPLLAVADVVATAFSSVAFEALAFDTPAIITHPIGKNLYAEYIAHGYFDYADGTETFYEAVRNAGQTGRARPPSPYICTDPKVAREALDRCLGNT